MIDKLEPYNVYVRCSSCGVVDKFLPDERFDHCRVCGHRYSVFSQIRFETTKESKLEIQRTKDKVVLSEAQITAILKNHIEVETGRCVYSGPFFQQNNKWLISGWCELTDPGEP